MTDGIAFTVETDNGPVRALLTAAARRTLAGRSHISGPDLLSIYRFELEQIVLRMVQELGRRDLYRIEPADL